MTDTREVLNTGQAVETEALGPITVKKLSVADIIETMDTVVAIAMRVWEDMQTATAALRRAGREGSIDANVRAVASLAKSAGKDLLSVLEPCTGKTSAELATLSTDDFMDVIFAFVEVHERSIKRFFELRAKLAGLVPKPKATKAPSGKPSIASSPPDGATKT